MKNKGFLTALYNSPTKTLTIPVDAQPPLQVKLIPTGLTGSDIKIIATNYSGGISQEATVKGGGDLEKAISKVLANSLLGMEYEHVYNRLVGIITPRRARHVYYHTMILYGLENTDNMPYDKFIEKVVYETVAVLVDRLEEIKDEYSRPILTIVKELLK